MTDRRAQRNAFSGALGVVHVFVHDLTDCSILPNISATHPRRTTQTSLSVLPTELASQYITWSRCQVGLACSDVVGLNVHHPSGKLEVHVTYRANGLVRTTAGPNGPTSSWRKAALYTGLLGLRNDMSVTEPNHLVRDDESQCWSNLSVACAVGQINQRMP